MICRGGDWRTGGSCHLEALPDRSSSLVPPHTWARYSIFRDVMSSRSNTSNQGALHVLNVTHLTSRRKDGHSSMYYLGPTVGPAPINRQDCSHWCLPGIPDTWNELLYALFMKRKATQSLNTSTIQVQWSKVASRIHVLLMHSTGLRHLKYKDACPIKYRIEKIQRLQDTGGKARTNISLLFQDLLLCRFDMSNWR